VCGGRRGVHRGSDTLPARCGHTSFWYKDFTPGAPAAAAAAGLPTHSSGFVCDQGDELLGAPAVPAEQAGCCWSVFPTSIALGTCTHSHTEVQPDSSCLHVSNTLAPTPQHSTAQHSTHMASPGPTALLTPASLARECALGGLPQSYFTGERAKRWHPNP